MKELELFEKLLRDELNASEAVMGLHDYYGQELPEVSIIRKALTPPTQEEVCAKLSEYIKRPIEYYAPAKQFVIRCSNGYHEIARLHGTNEISFDTTYCLPPHIIIDIGRFYEGLEK